MSKPNRSVPQARNSLVEHLERRQLLSVTPGVATALEADGFVPVAWNGQQVLAKAGQWVMQVAGLRGNAPQQIKGVNDLLGKVRKDVKAVRQLGADGLVLVKAPPKLGHEKLKAALGKVPGLRTLEPDLAVWSAALSNDTQSSSLWGLHNIGQTGGTLDADIDAPEAWSLVGGRGPVVGVVDSGVDYSHPDLAGNIWKNPGEIAGDGKDNDGNGYVDDAYGWDFANSDNDPMDDNGHGTHVAGTIAAVKDNGVGVAGVAPGAQIMALKFLSANGSGTLSGAIGAVNYATKMRSSYGVDVRVVNHSWITSGYSSQLYDAMNNSGLAGILSVAAAGNGGSDGIGDNNDSTPMYPASFNLDSVVAVAATDHNDGLASFSNYGSTSVDLAAPGVSILSTLPGGGYGWYGGTSMAAPHVSGAAALAWSASPGASYQTVRNALMKGVDSKSTLSGKLATGGRLNAHGMLLQMPATPAAPSDLAATVISGSRVDLTWTDGSGNETGFRIYRSVDGVQFSVVATVGANVTTYANDGLAAGTTYHYRVTAYNGIGESAASNTATGTTTAEAVVPAAPSSLSATAASSSRVDLKWTDGSAEEEGFRVYRSTDGVTFGYLATVGANSTAYSDSSVAASTAYWYLVRAYNSAGESGNSNLAGATTPASVTAVPAAPTNLAAVGVSSSRVNLNWTDNATNDDGFHIERSTNGTSWLQVSTVGKDVTAFADTGLKKRKTYYYRIRAYNAAGNSAYSEVASTMTAASGGSFATQSLFASPSATLGSNVFSSSSRPIAGVDDAENVLLVSL